MHFNPSVTDLLMIFSIILWLSNCCSSEHSQCFISQSLMFLAYVPWAQARSHFLPFYSNACGIFTWTLLWIRCRWQHPKSSFDSWFNCCSKNRSWASSLWQGSNSPSQSTWTFRDSGKLYDPMDGAKKSWTSKSWSLHLSPHGAFLVQKNQKTDVRIEIHPRH